jgi:hypothetical protein
LIVAGFGFSAWAVADHNLGGAALYAGAALGLGVLANLRRLPLVRMTPERQVTLAAPAFALASIPSTVALILHARGAAMSSWLVVKHAITIACFLGMAALLLWGKQRLRQMGLFDEPDTSSDRIDSAGEEPRM